MAGALAHRFGAPHTVLFTGASVLVGTIWFTFQLPRINRTMHPIYAEKGLIPEHEITAAPEPNQAAANSY